MLRSWRGGIGLVWLATALGGPPAAASREGDARCEPAAPAAAVQIGEQAPDFAFVDIRALRRRFHELGDHRAYVVVATSLNCPLVKRYLPVIRDLARAYRDRDVCFLALNVGPGDALREVAAQGVRADLDFPLGKDLDGTAQRALGLRRTPEAVVLDAERRIVYRGRIDDQYRLGGVREKATRHDLQAALDELLAGQPISVPETETDGCRITPPDPPRPVSGGQVPTYNGQVAGLLARHCQECHRPGGNGPFSLVTYDDARAQAEMLAEVVQLERMPPWYASEAHGDFTNRRGLSDDERRTLLDWVRADCPRGDGAPPPAREFTSQPWRIGEPDLVLQAAFEEQIPEKGVIPYRYVVLPHLFAADTWVQGVEIKPSNPAVVHHANMGHITVGQRVSADNFITGQVPGGEAMILTDGIGFKIPAGSLLALQIHYVTTGERTTDRISVGLRFPRETIRKQLKHLQIANLQFTIPPGAAHHRVEAARTLPCDATGVGMYAHMHLRGKDMTFVRRAPDGTEETLLLIPNYNFEWQHPYRWKYGAMKFAKGTRIECVAHFDNSAFNPYNPDPRATVREGQQTFNEMMYGFFFYTDDGEELNLQVDPATGRARP